MLLTAASSQRSYRRAMSGAGGVQCWPREKFALRNHDALLSVI